MPTCFDCGIDKEQLLTHHLNSFRDNNNPENLRRICYQCHSIRHKVLPKGKSSHPNPIRELPEYSDYIETRNITFPKGSVLGTVASVKQAIRLLDEIAVSGHWRTLGSGKLGPVYAKGGRKVSVERLGFRAYGVVVTKE